MPNKRFARKSASRRTTWRDYQAGLRRKAENKVDRRHLGKIVAGLVVAVCGVYAVLGMLHASACQKQGQSKARTRHAPLTGDTIGKQDVRIILQQTPLAVTGAPPSSMTSLAL